MTEQNRFWALFSIYLKGCAWCTAPYFLMFLVDPTFWWVIFGLIIMFPMAPLWFLFSFVCIHSREGNIGLCAVSALVFLYMIYSTWKDARGKKPLDELIARYRRLIYIPSLISAGLLFVFILILLSGKI